MQLDEPQQAPDVSYSLPNRAEDDTLRAEGNAPAIVEHWQRRYRGLAVLRLVSPSRLAAVHRAIRQAQSAGGWDG